MRKGNPILKKIDNVAFMLEIVLALFLIIAVIIGMKDIFSYLGAIYRTPAIETYDIFKQFLAHILLLVVGIELILMLVSHSIDSIIEFILFVIARKMLIYADTMLDLLLGTLAIAILFLTIKYALSKTDVIKSNSIEEKEGSKD
nr:hypothetical protein [Tissierella sp.]